jgi:hypothetical protein
MIDREGKWANREGLATVGVLPQHGAQQAILRSLPRVTDAMRLTERVIARMGDRLYPDVMAGMGNHLLFVRDASDPRFLVSHAFIAMDANVPAPEPIPFAPLELPEHLKAPAAPAEPAPERPRVLPGPDRFPGKLRIAEGPAHLDISYGPDGTKSETVQSGGDTWTWGYHHEDRPFAVDPFAKPAQYPPIGLYCRGDLDPDGHDLDTLAGMVAELDPTRLVHGRVFVPVAMPGGAAGCWMRGLWRLREALWDGRIGEQEAGWAVIDAWNGTVAVVGPTLDVAFARWQQAVARAQPLPPRDPPPAPEPDDVPDEAPSSEYDEERKIARFSSGTIRIVAVPRVILDWPDARPENVPAVAVPLPPAAPVPPEWERYGFTRRARLVGEHGAVCTAFVRDEGHGCFTLVGEGALPALGPATLDAELDRIDVDRRREVEESGFWIRRNPYTNPDYPWMVPCYRAWDDLGRTPQLREGGIGWTAEVAARGFDGDHMRWTVTRVRRWDAGGVSADRGALEPTPGG